MADIKKQLMEFLETLRDTHKLFLKNGRLMASIASFAALAYSLLLLINFLSQGSLVSYVVSKLSFLLAMSSSDPEFANNLGIILMLLRHIFGAERVFLEYYIAFSVFFYSATIIASAVSHTDGHQDTPCRPRDVVFAAARCLKRPLITYLYVSTFGVGYLMILLAIILPFALPRASAVAIAIVILAVLFYTYLSVVWTMGMVVSVQEEKSGIVALGKAGQLVEGEGALHLKGYGIAFMETLLSYGVMQMWKVVGIGSIGSSSYMPLLVGMVAVTVLCLVRMYGLMGFTILYYEAKRNHGEEIKAVLATNITMIPSHSPPLIPDNLP